MLKTWWSQLSATESNLRQSDEKYYSRWFNAPQNGLIQNANGWLSDWKQRQFERGTTRPWNTFAKKNCLICFNFLLRCQRLILKMQIK